MKSFDAIKKQDNEFIANTYSRFDVSFVSGKNARFIDESGKDYIDFGSGIGTNSLGIANAEWAEAVSLQAATMQHCSNLYYNPVTAALAEKLCGASGMKKVFFGNSGAEANECAIKTARKYSFDKYGAAACRNKIITLVNSFHGRTVTTLSATGQDVFHNYFFPFTDGFVFCSPDIDAIKNTVKEDGHVCAVMLETIQGEGGVLPLEDEFLRELETFAKSEDILLIVDEIQTGIARTGRFLSYMHSGISPDIVTLAKGLGGGLPIGACLFNGKTEKVLSFGDHGSTFGGNPVSCAGANVVLDKVTANGFCEEVAKKGEYIKMKLKEKLGEEITEIRGRGLMLGIDFRSKTAKEIVSEGLKNGVVMLTAKKSVRLLPPLTITYDEIDEGINRLVSVFA